MAETPRLDCAQDVMGDGHPRRRHYVPIGGQVGRHIARRPSVGFVVTVEAVGSEASLGMAVGPLVDECLPRREVQGSCRRICVRRAPHRLIVVCPKYPTLTMLMRFHHHCCMQAKGVAQVLPVDCCFFQLIDQQKWQTCERRDVFYSLI